MSKNSLTLFIFSSFLAIALLVGSITPASALPMFASQQADPNPKKNPPGQAKKGKHKSAAESPSGRVSNTSHSKYVNSTRLIVTITPDNFKVQAGLGEPFTLEGFINDQNGNPVPNKPITFRINGAYLGSVRSNDVGVYKHKFSNFFSSGTYLITASSTESHLLLATTTTTTLKILPSVVRIQTVPATAGIPFTMAGIRFVSGGDGIATVNMTRPGTYRLDVLTDEYHNPSNHIEFARWLDDSYTPSKFIQVPTSDVIQVGFNVYHQVGQSFLDLDSRPVDSTRVTEFTIRSAQGDMFVLHDGQPRWIPASRVARRANGLEETQLLYSVLSVTINGSNVVNSSQQRFYTYPIENWPISLLLYSMQISAKDGLFGTPVGKSVNIEFPDGHIENYPLNADGVAEIPSLARGNYTTELVGIKGLSSRTPVALSRNQVITTKVITYTDLAVVGLLGALVAMGLLLYGRPKMFMFGKKSTQLITAEETIPAISIPLPEQVFDFRNMRYETVKLLDDKDFKKNIGLERELFEKMLAFFAKDSHNSPRKSKLSEADQILMTILFLQGRHTRFDISQIYQVSETTVRRTVNKVKEAMHDFIQTRQLSDTDVNLTDILGSADGEVKELTDGE